MMIILYQSFSCVNLRFNFVRDSVLINVATLVNKELHPEIGAPTLVPTPIKDTDVPTVTLLTTAKISENDI